MPKTLWQRFSFQSKAKGPWGRGWGFPFLIGHMQHPPADQSRTLSAILGNSSMYSLLYHQSYLQNATLIAKTTNFKIVLSYFASITEKWSNFRFRSRGLHVLAPHPQNAFFITAGDLKTRQISRAQEAAPRFDFCLPCWCAANTLTAKEFRLFPSVIWWVVHSFSCL